MNLGSRSLRRPSNGLRKTATKSEFEVSGAKSPTKMLYSFWYCCCGIDTVPLVVEKAEVMSEQGIDEAKFIKKGLLELGI